MLQQLFLLVICRMSKTTNWYSCRYFYMLSISALLHLVKVDPEPVDAFSKHLIFKIFGMAQESYWEFI